MSVVSAIIVAIAVVVGFTAHEITKKNDSPVEQVAETVIKVESGVDVDFSAQDKAEVDHGA